MAGIDSQSDDGSHSPRQGSQKSLSAVADTTLESLCAFWRTHRHPVWLFTAEGRDHTGRSTSQTPMSISTVQSTIKSITVLNFGKPISIQTLRQSCAMHMLEAGVSLRAIRKKYLGHSSLQTATNAHDLKRESTGP